MTPIQKATELVQKYGKMRALIYVNSALQIDYCHQKYPIGDKKVNHQTYWKLVREEVNKLSWVQNYNNTTR